MSSPALYWSRRSFRADTIASGLKMLEKVLNDLSMFDVNRSGVDVSGRTATTHVAITLIDIPDNDDPNPCDGVGVTDFSNEVIVMVIVAGDGAKIVRDNVNHEISKIKFL